MLKKISQNVYLFLIRNRFYVFTILSFAVLTAYYMRPSVEHCTSVVYGFGDNTGGPIWRFSIDPNHPLGGLEKVTNYPFGDNLYSPVSYSLILQVILFWGFAKLVGPVCGFNFLNILGFMTSALVMFGFIYWLTRRKWLAWLAGYAVTFAPYFQTKVGSHPGYGYQALLIGILWAFLAVIKTGRKKWAGVLALLSATCFYFDPYFSLLALSILIPLFIAFAGVAVARRIRSGRWPEIHIRAFMLSAAVFIIALLPLAYVKIRFGSQIDATVSSSRGNTLLAAEACSIYPHEYLLPFAANPLFTKALGSNKTKVQSTLYGFANCNVAEDSINISLFIMVLLLAGLIILSWEKLNKRLLGYRSIVQVDPAILFTCLIGVMALAFLVALPPIKVLRVPTLSYILLHLTSIWRIVEREFVVLNIAFITLFAVVASYFLSHFKFSKRMGVILFALLFIGVFAEYQTFNPLHSGSFISFSYNEAPPTYYWVAQSQDIHVIAEYPIERVGTESDAIVYYTTMQTIHKKPLFNSVLPESPQEPIRSSIKNLADPQTVPVLHAMGVDTIIVHGVEAAEVAKIPYLQIVYVGNHGRTGRVPPSRTIEDGQLVVAKITNSPKPSAMLTFSKEPLYNGNIIKSAVEWQYEMQQDNAFIIKGIAPNSTQAPLNVCFAVKMAGVNDRDTLSLIVDGKQEQTIQLDNQYVEVKLTASQSIKLHNTSGHNMRVAQLGCKT
jgi:hypothetical protein